MIRLKLFNGVLGKYTGKAAHPSAASIHEIHTAGCVSGSTTMVMLFIILVVLCVAAVWSSCCHSSNVDKYKRITLRWGYGCDKVSHPGMHHTCYDTSFYGAVGVWLSSQDQLIKTYSDDQEMSTICNLVCNPSQINSMTLNLVNYNYRAALCQSQIVIEDDMLIFDEPIQGGSSCTCLQLIPKEFYNIIFVAFYSNAIGGNINAYRTLHYIRLRYYWPGMCSYIKQMCAAYPGCALVNLIRSKSSVLVYNFPIEAPFTVLFVNGY